MIGQRLAREFGTTSIFVGFRSYEQASIVVVDLFPPTPSDPNGLHGEIWKLLDNDSFLLSSEEPLVLASYSAGSTKVAYVEPTAVGKELIDMPLFLTADRYVPIPLEETYTRAYSGLPQRWQHVLASDDSPR